MNRKISPVLIVIALILVVGIVGVITIVVNRYRPTTTMADSTQYFGAIADDEAVIIIDGEMIESRGKVIDGKVYLSEDIVQRYVNSKFYWDIHGKKMIYTTPTKVLEVSDNIHQIEDDYYLELGIISEYTDIQCEQYEDPSRVVIFTHNEPFVEARMIKDSAVRVKGGVKSEILKNVADQEVVLVLEELDNWSKVLTMDGYIGYTLKSDMEVLGEITKPAPKSTSEYTSITRDYKINLAWHQTMSQKANESLADVVKDAKGLNVISPTWFSVIDTDGKISSLASAEYVRQAHDMGLEVWGLIDNFNPDVKTFDVLSYTEKRANIIEQLITIAKEVGLDGLNIDFESITEETGPHYVQFLREIAIRCRAENLVLSVDNPPPFPYNKHYNLKEQGEVVDYVIIMGYDEHYSGGDAAGSVASLGFVRTGIEESLRSVPKEKLINGIPFYTRVWREPYGSSNITSEVLGMNGADNYVAEHQMVTHWDANAGQMVAELDGEEALYRIWLENEESIAKKMELIREHDLAGVAAWKLGFERSSIWEVIAQGLE